MISGPSTSWQIEGETMETATDFIFLASKITADGECSHEIKRHLLLGRKAMTTDKGPSSQSYGFSSSHVCMWELDHKEGWAQKNLRYWTVVLEKTLESPLDSKEIKPVNPKGNLPWIIIGRTDAEAPILWPPDVKRWLIGKDLDAGKDWGQEEKRTTEDQMVGWHHWFNGHEFEQALGDGEGQTGKHSVLQSMGWQRVRHDSVTELIEATFTSLHFTSNYKRIQKFKAKL